MLKESLLKKVNDFGYEYAKDIYDHWVEYYVDEEDDESYYKGSYDSDNHPYKDNLEDQVSEQSWHAFYCCELFENLEFNEEEETMMDKTDNKMYDAFLEGVERLFKEKYK